MCYQGCVKRLLSAELISGAETIIAIKAVGTVMFAKAVTAFRGTEFVIDAAMQ